MRSSGLSETAARALPAAQIGFVFMLALFEGPAQILCVVAIVVAFAAGALRGYRPGFVELGILIWALAGCVGHLSFEGEASSTDLTRPIQAVALLVGFTIAKAPPRVLGRVALAFGLAFTINAAYGLLQRVVGELPLDPYLLSNPRSGQIWTPGWPRITRAASGLFYNRLKLAHVGAVVLVMVVPLVIDRKLDRKWRLLAGGALVISGAGVLFAYARMALVALVAGLAVTFGLIRVRLRTILAFAAVGVVTVVLVLASPQGERVTSSLTKDAGIRKAMMSAGVEVAKAYPIFGAGHGVYRSVVGPHMPANLARVTHTSPHNQFLQVLAETGIVGLFGFSMMFFGALWIAVRNARSLGRGQGADAHLARWALSTLVVVFVVGLTHFALHHATVGLVFWVALGVIRGQESAGRA